MGKNKILLTEVTVEDLERLNATIDDLKWLLKNTRREINTCKDYERRFKDEAFLNGDRYKSNKKKIDKNKKLAEIHYPKLLIVEKLLNERIKLFKDKEKLHEKKFVDEIYEKCLGLKPSKKTKKENNGKE